MCKVMQEIVDAEVREAKEEERKKASKDAIRDLIKLEIPKEKILSLGHSEELYNEVLAEM